MGSYFVNRKCAGTLSRDSADSCVARDRFEESINRTGASEISIFDRNSDRIHSPLPIFMALYSETQARRRHGACMSACGMGAGYMCATANEGHGRRRGAILRE